MAAASPWPVYAAVAYGRWWLTTPRSGCACSSTGVRGLGRARTEVTGRLHQLVLELIPGGAKRFLTRGQAGHLLAAVPTPVDIVARNPPSVGHSLRLLMTSLVNDGYVEVDSESGDPRPKPPLSRTQVECPGRRRTGRHRPRRRVDGVDPVVRRTHARAN
jgi:hypothetical protein